MITHGQIAQLGERRTRIAKVAGSIPVLSTSVNVQRRYLSLRCIVSPRGGILADTLVSRASDREIVRVRDLPRRHGFVALMAEQAILNHKVASSSLAKPTL